MSDAHEHGHPHHDAGVADSLSVQIEGTRKEAERVLVLSRPRNGVVEAREFAVGCTAPRELTLGVDEAYRIFERAERDRRRLGESLYAIRLWLGVRA
jgi:hypothetical protein